MYTLYSKTIKLIRGLKMQVMIPKENFDILECLIKTCKEHDGKAIIISNESKTKPMFSRVVKDKKTT